MNRQLCGFVPWGGPVRVGASSRSSPFLNNGPLCARRRPRSVSQVRMARYEKKEETNSPAGEDTSSPLRPPPGALPTLSSLSGRKTTGDDTPPSVVGRMGRDPPPVEVQGGGLSATDEQNVIAFLKEVYSEFGIIEWPTAGRVIKVTIIVIATMVVASAFIYTVDGFFLWLSKIVFETSV